MENEFVSYTQALALEKLGFNEPVINVYDFKSKELVLNEDDEMIWSPVLPNNGATIAAPLYQQAFRFFREKYKQDYLIVPSGDSTGKTNGYYYEIVFDFSKENIESESFKTYEEAESACLDELIEITKKT